VLLREGKLVLPPLKEGEGSIDLSPLKAGDLLSIQVKQSLLESLSQLPSRRGKEVEGRESQIPLDEIISLLKKAKGEKKLENSPAGEVLRQALMIKDLLPGGEGFHALLSGLDTLLELQPLRMVVFLQFILGVSPKKALSMPYGEFIGLLAISRKLALLSGMTPEQIELFFLPDSEYRQALRRMERQRTQSQQAIAGGGALPPGISPDIELGR